MIVSGSSSQSLAAAVAAATDTDLAPVSFERFPDGELMAQVPYFDADEAVIVAATDTSDAHVEVLQLQDAVREAGADHVTTVIPYMGYARQDAAFEPGQPVSARAMARALSPGTDRVLTVNPHEPAITDHFDVPAETVDAAAQLADPLPTDLTEPVFLSPDEGAIDIAETVQEAYGRGRVDYFEKTRLSGSEVEIEPRDADVDGRDVVLADDIVATGSTMAESVAALDDMGAARVYVTCVHPMLAADATTKLARAGVEAIYGTDTLERAASTVSAAPAIVDAL
ncbi:ribose-phosphate diphosphokinase [Halorientalis pallida]|uniref:Ribose-phosphate pyrophosphokinase n=1 Tax=Halorientalis pallida TaxID=2479928 RepID=A0A498KXV2_9EURY|nr:ribose-phosphate diphosphokinase [Halorientalis pallida]RXK50169.1 ribose-phosphate diphosphokinase [Halorientalis pallida]